MAGKAAHSSHCGSEVPAALAPGLAAPRSEQSSRDPGPPAAQPLLALRQMQLPLQDFRQDVGKTLPS